MLKLIGMLFIEGVILYPVHRAYGRCSVNNLCLSLRQSERVAGL